LGCGDSKMQRLDEGAADPAGYRESDEIQVVIEPRRNASTGRGQVAATMFAAMMNGDVEAVEAALDQLGVLLSPQSMTSRLT
jgi:hypothetical protein